MRRSCPRVLPSLGPAHCNALLVKNSPKTEAKPGLIVFLRGLVRIVLGLGAGLKNLVDEAEFERFISL